jgi:hypothetical protein
VRYALLFLAALAGCAGAPQAPQRVEVPVPVPCKAPQIAKPSFAVDGLPLGADIWDMMLALRAERKQRQGYEAQLEAGLNACR